MGSKFRIVFEEDGYPRELINASDRARAVREGTLTPDQEVTVYRDGQPPGAFKARDLPELRPLFGIEEPEPPSSGAVDADLSLAQQASDARPKPSPWSSSVSGGIPEVRSKLEYRTDEQAEHAFGDVGATSHDGHGRDHDRAGVVESGWHPSEPVILTKGARASHDAAPLAWAFVPYRKYADFTGRAPRVEYWMFALLLLILASVVTATATSLLPWFLVGSVLPSLAVTVRRLHDTNRSGWWLLVGFVPYVGWLILLILLVVEGTKGSNQYGADPLS